MNQKSGTTIPGKLCGLQRLFPVVHSNMEKCPGFLDVIQRILDKTSDEDEIFSISTWQNSVSLLTSGPISYNLTLKYFMENFHSIRQRLYYTQDLWHPFVSNICSAIKTKDQLDKFFTFYQDNKRKFGYSQETINETLKRAVKEIKWREHNLPVIGKCFDEVVRKYLKY